MKLIFHLIQLIINYDQIKCENIKENMILWCTSFILRTKDTILALLEMRSRLIDIAGDNEFDSDNEADWHVNYM